MQIGEVARRAAMSARMLRHYDRIGLVTASQRTASGYREYSDVDLHRLLHVELLRSLGLSLQEVGQALGDPRADAAGAVDELLAATRERIARERQLLEQLERIRAAAPGDWSDVLATVSALRTVGDVDAPRRQRFALEAGTTGSVAAQELADALSAEADPNVAGTLSWALARADAPVESLRPSLESSDAGIRLRAVDALTKLSGSASDAALEAALDDPDPVIRGRAALAAARRGLVVDTDVLVGMIVRGDHDVDAAEALGARAHGAGAHGAEAHGAEAPYADALARLADVLRARETVPGARSRALQALAEFPADAVRGILEEFVDDADPAVARPAQAFLTR